MLEVYFEGNFSTCMFHPSILGMYLEHYIDNPFLLLIFVSGVPNALVYFLYFGLYEKACFQLGLIKIGSQRLHIVPYDVKSVLKEL